MPVECEDPRQRRSGECNSNADDCDDSDSTLNPNTVWWLDADGDGYGGDSPSAPACEEPTGYVRTSDDCDDTRSNWNVTCPWVAVAAGAFFTCGIRW